MPSKSKPSACPTAETPRTSKTSIKTPTSKSQKPSFSPTIHKSKADQKHPSSHSLPQFQTEIPKFLQFPSSYSGNVTPVQIGLDISLLPKLPKSSLLVPEPLLSIKLSQSPPTNLEFPTQSKQYSCVPESPSSANRLQPPLSLVSFRPNPPPKSLEPNPHVNTPSGFSVSHKALPDVCSRYRSTSTYRNTPLCRSCTSISGEHNSTLSHQDTHVLNVIQSHPSAMKVEDDLSMCMCVCMLSGDKRLIIFACSILYFLPCYGYIATLMLHSVMMLWFRLPLIFIYINNITCNHKSVLSHVYSICHWFSSHLLWVLS